MIFTHEDLRRAAVWGLCGPWAWPIYVRAIERIIRQKAAPLSEGQNINVIQPKGEEYV